MKLHKSIILPIAALMLSACHDLDRNPLSSGSTENWYSTETEVEMAVNDLYYIGYWQVDGQNETDWSDDSYYRNTVTAFENGTLNGQNQFVTRRWEMCYKAIAHANAVIEKSHRAIENGASATTINRLIGEAKFHRAAAYSKLIIKFGDVPLVLSDLDLENAFDITRTPKKEVLTQIYADFDAAADVLPTSYAEAVRATKGAALALKARVALIMGDWATAAKAAKGVMDLNIYELHDDFANLFLSGTKVSKEFIFKIPRAVGYSGWSYGEHVDDWGYGQNATYNAVTRTPGGWGAANPSWDLLAAFTCTDGLPIDESPLFDSHEPFKNRDPRLSMTIVPFGSEWMGYEFDPSPAAKEVMNYATGKKVTNNDSRINAQYASFNGLYWKKGIDATWMQNGWRVGADIIWCRYAEVLLTYAEAKIELNQIDESVIEALNKVRARAYGVSVSDTGMYPAFTNVGQDKLRQQLRVERRMEMAKEGMRYTDITRWHLSEICMKRHNYGMLYPATDCLEQIVEKGEWFWPFAPDIDENGLPDFTKLEAAGKIMVLSQRSWDPRQYLWPLPTTDIMINDKMTNNPGY